MKTRVTETKISSAKKQKDNNSYDFLSYNDNETFEFVGLYKTAAETTKILEKGKSKAPDANENIKNNNKRERPSGKKPKKHKQELVKLSHVNIDASSLNSSAGARPQINSEATPSSSSMEQVGNVKSIMKNTSSTDQSADSARSNKSSGKPKKRNKSVSFMLDDNEEVLVKRTKSDDSVITNKNVENANEYVKNKKSQKKKLKKSEQSEKENTTTNINKAKMDVNNVSAASQMHKADKSKIQKTTESETPTSEEVDKQIQEKKTKFKKIKKQKVDAVPNITESGKKVAESESIKAASEIKSKKLKKKKLKKSASLDTEDETEEPNAKSRKTESEKPDIVEDLENLSIGDNAHTLTNLLDEMTVVDKNKKKKHKVNKKLKSKEQNKEVTDQMEGKEKEKVKWNKRKWNKDKKGVLDDDGLVNTVVVENLPLNIMLNYKKLLSEHFVKYGLIKSMGLAEVYPTEESKPVFTTTIHFYSDGAATQALELNNTEFEGSRIRVKHPLPRTATTIVVRSYGELTDQNISSAFLGAGKIRSIRHLVKGKKSMATSFVEFDGPEAVKYALTKMTERKIGGKKIHVAKFEPRQKKEKVKEQKNDGDSAADADSEDSND